MGINKKYYPYLIGGAVAIAYLSSRLYNILAVPIFTDEAIYIRWTQIFRGDIHQFFISLTDGKQPLFIWLGTLFLHFARNPLLDVRLVSVCSGLLTMVGIYFITKELFDDKRMAVVASALYIIFPIALVYDKLALYDSMLSTFAVWALYLEIRLVKNKRLSTAIAAALVIGGGLLTKSSAWFFLYLLPFSLLLYNFKSKQRNKDLMKWAVLALIVVAGSFACYSMLRFSPNFHYIADKNNAFVYPVHVWIKHPFSYLADNTPLLLKELVGYTTIPFLFLATAAFGFGRKFTKEKILLVVWFALPFAVLDLFGNFHYLYPRYFLFMTMFLLPLVAFSIVGLVQKIRPWYVPVIICSLLLVPMLYKDYYILADFPKASIPLADREQFISGYASGVGVDKTVEFILQQSQKQKIYIGTEGIFGLMPESLQNYLNGNTNVVIKGFWPIDNAPPQELLDAAKTMPTYFIFYAPCPACDHSGIAPKNWPLKEVFQIKKLEKDTFYTLYKVTPQ